uniref:Aminotransferase n=1 Tax=uncultured marine thaumarchaeote KM3_72_A09 TaxID=1456261 RepID=A0A075HPW8_9ARCH|nr:class I/II aminotransferase (aspB) [uncultured marine thaumarchaeote KM3_72_A09]
MNNINEIDDLEKLRKQISEITTQLISLVGERMSISRKIAMVKNERQLGVEDSDVEKMLRRAVLERCAKTGVPDAFGLRILNLLMAESIRLQKDEKSSNAPEQRVVKEHVESHMKLFGMAKQMEENGERVIHLEVGEPDFPPPRPVVAGISNALEVQHTHYTGSRGILKLREALANKFNQKSIKPISESNVIATPGGRFAIYLAMHAMISQGGEVIIPEPAWPCFKQAAEEVGGRPVIVKTRIEDGWKLSPDAVEEKITDTTEMIVLNSPSNPTGKVLEPETTKAIVKLAADNDIPVLSDGVYADYAYVPCTGVEEIVDSGYIAIQSFSKSYGMTGFRVGYAIADEAVIAKMAKLQSLALTSIPEFIQYAAIDALNCQEDVARNVEQVRQRIDISCAALENLPLTFSKPEGGMYVFPRIDIKNFDSGEFAYRLLTQKKVAIAPGHGFGDYPDYLRICLCQSEDVLLEAIEKIGELLR